MVSVISDKFQICNRRVSCSRCGKSVRFVDGFTEQDLFLVSNDPFNYGISGYGSLQYPLTFQKNGKTVPRAFSRDFYRNLSLVSLMLPELGNALDNWVRNQTK